MILVVLLVVAAAAYLNYTGQLTARLVKRIVTGAIALAALRLGFEGSPIGGLVLGTVAALLFWSGERGRGSDVTQARALLGVSATAGPDQIRAAHRMLASAAHPDIGGNHVDMAALNAARDLLLARARASG